MSLCLDSPLVFKVIKNVSFYKICTDQVSWFQNYIAFSSEEIKKVVCKGFFFEYLQLFLNSEHGRKRRHLQLYYKTKYLVKANTA